jgi:hypothetical protein
LLTQGDGLINTYDNYDGYDSYGDSNVTVGTILAVYAGVIVFSLIVAAIAYVLIAIPLAALFRKTGIEPWKAWVPFYATYEWLRLGGQNGHWVWLSLVPYGSIATSVFLYMGMYRTGKAFGKESGFLVLGIFLPVPPRAHRRRGPRGTARGLRLGSARHSGRAVEPAAAAGAALRVVEGASEPTRSRANAHTPRRDRRPCRTTA